jgi:hypothetical protein
LQGFEGSLYVLRRSASYGSSFLSITRSDACLTNQGAPTVFPYILHHLLLLAIKNVLKGEELSSALSQLAKITEKNSLAVFKDEEATATSQNGGGGEEGGDKWPVAVHALNVLRLVFLDAFIGEHVFPYVSLGIKVMISSCCYYVVVVVVVVVTFLVEMLKCTFL